MFLAAKHLMLAYTCCGACIVLPHSFWSGPFPVGGWAFFRFSDAVLLCLRMHCLPTCAHADAPFVSAACSFLCHVQNGSPKVGPQVACILPCGHQCALPVHSFHQMLRVAGTMFIDLVGTMRMYAGEPSEASQPTVGSTHSMLAAQ